MVLTQTRGSGKVTSWFSSGRAPPTKQPKHESSSSFYIPILMSFMTSPEGSGFTPRREFLRDQQPPTANSFSLMAIAGANCIRLYSFPLPLMTALRRLLDSKNLVAGMFHLAMHWVQNSSRSQLCARTSASKCARLPLVENHGPARKVFPQKSFWSRYWPSYTSTAIRIFPQ